MTGDDDSGDATTLDTDAATGFRVSTAPPRTGRYERGDEIARGGLGTVTSALDRTLQRRVAIKELHTRTEQGRQRFMREALTTARLQHPAIVPVFDAGTWEAGDPYLVLKLLEGKTLAEQLATTTSMASRLALIPSLLAVADALGYAHEQKVVHRDVKPANIMTGSHGETVLLDWGIAHDDAAAGDPGDAIAGTPRYMSLEQARGEPASPRFDVYSLGLTIAAVLGAEIPFAGVAADDILARVRASGRPRVKLPDEVPVDLASIVAKALAPAADRYADASELAGDLRKFIAGQLVSARSYTTRQLVGRWLRRNRVLVAIAGMAAAVVIATAIVAITSVVHERNVAVDERAQAIAREHELVLQQARAALRTDPTAAIAWLKQYPIDAPHQDELVALVDEAEGRGVARHVWRAADEPADAGFADDGTLISANRDGEVVRADPTTGSLRRLAKLAVPAVFARVHGRDAVVLDRDGGVYRISDAGTTTVATMAMRSKPSGVFVMPSGELKITFVDNEATWIPAESPHKPSAGDFVFADEAFQAAAVLGVSADGTLVVADPEPRALHRFAPRTWVRGSDDGKSYLAIEPGEDQTATVWMGTTDRASHLVLGHQRACATGEYRAQQAELDVAGRIAAVYRCGVLAVYDIAEHRPIPIADPDRVRYFVLSADARWLAIGRSDGLDVIELASGASRRFVGGSGVSTVGFAPHGDVLYSAGAEHGLRVWSLHGGATIGRLGDVVTPTSLALSTRPGELAIGQNLDCAVWNIVDRRVATTSSVAMGSTRQPDDVDSLWPWHVSADGRACVFAGRRGTAIVAAATGPIFLSAEASVDDCVLSDDGAEAWCQTSDDKLVMFDLAHSAARRARDAGGKVRGLARYRGGSLAVIDRGRACRVEKFDGTPIATLAPECRSARASNAAQPGRETGLVITRAHATEVWTERGSLSLAGDPQRTEVSPGGLVAVAREREVEVWDIATRARRAGPIDHLRDVRLVAWSPSGILASSDDDIVQLWDPESGLTRAIYAPHTTTIVWSADGHTLFTSDGRVIEAWRIDLATGASPSELRARLDALTSARIVDGRVTTP